MIWSNTSLWQLLSWPPGTGPAPGEEQLNYSMKLLCFSTHLRTPHPILGLEFCHSSGTYSLKLVISHFCVCTLNLLYHEGRGWTTLVQVGARVRGTQKQLVGVSWLWSSCSEQFHPTEVTAQWLIHRLQRRQRLP